MTGTHCTTLLSQLCAPSRFVAALALLFVAMAGTIAAGDAAPPLNPGLGEDDKEKPREAPFKFSAWTPLNQLNLQLPAERDIPESTHTRPLSAQYTGFGRPGQWTAVIVELRNTTEKFTFSGSLSINVQPLTPDENMRAPYNTGYAQSFEVGPKTEKQYRFSVLCPENGWNGPFRVNVVSNGLPYERDLTVANLDLLNDDLVLAICENPTGFRFLQRKRKPDDEKSIGRAVSVVDPAELPSRWHDLTVANLIIIDGPPRETLSPEQWAALKSYVQAGGHVLVCAGKDPTRLKGALEEFCGITVNGMTELRSLDGDDFGLRPQQIKQDIRLPVVDVTVSPAGAPIVRRNKATQLVESVRRFAGTGSVTFLPYSLSDPALSAWTGRDEIPAFLLNQGRDRRLFQNRLGEANEDSENFNAWGGWAVQQKRLNSDALFKLREALDNSFANDTPVEQQARATVLGFLLLYLLAAVPLSYFIFGWLQRRELSWVCVPLISGVFCALAWYIGHYGQSGMLTINQVTVVEAGTRQPVGIARTFLAIYSPQREDYRVSFPPLDDGSENGFDMQAAPNHLLTTAALGQREVENPELSIVEKPAGMELTGLRVQYRSTRHLEVQHRAALGEGLDVNAEETTDGKLNVTVTNNTRAPLLFPTLILRGRALPLGHSVTQVLAPGAKAEFKGLPQPGTGREPWTGIDEGFFGKQVVLTGMNGPHIPPRVRAVTDYLRNASERFHQGVVVGWMDNAPHALPMNIQTSWGRPTQPKFEPITLLVVPAGIRNSNRPLATLPDTLRADWSAYFYRGNNWGSWNRIGSDGVQLQAWPQGGEDGATAPNCAQVFVKLNFPENTPAMVAQGYGAELSFDVATEVYSGVVRPVDINGQRQRRAVIDGDLQIDVLTEQGPNLHVWEPLQTQRLNAVHTGGVKTVRDLRLPLKNTQRLSNGEMKLRVWFQPFQGNNARYQMKLENVRHRMLQDR